MRGASGRPLAPPMSPVPTTTPRQLVRPKTHAPSGIAQGFSILNNRRCARTHDRTWPIGPRSSQKCLPGAWVNRRRAQASPLPFACTERTAVMRVTVGSALASFEDDMRRCFTVLRVFQACGSGCPDGDDSVARFAADGTGALSNRRRAQACSTKLGRQRPGSQSRPTFDNRARTALVRQPERAQQNIRWMEGIPSRRR